MTRWLSVEDIQGHGIAIFLITMDTFCNSQGGSGWLLNFSETELVLVGKITPKADKQAVDITFGKRENKFVQYGWHKQI